MITITDVDYLRIDRRGSFYNFYISLNDETNSLIENEEYEIFYKSKYYYLLVNGTGFKQDCSLDGNIEIRKTLNCSSYIESDFKIDNSVKFETEVVSYDTGGKHSSFYSSLSKKTSIKVPKDFFDNETSVKQVELQCSDKRLKLYINDENIGVQPKNFSLMNKLYIYFFMLAGKLLKEDEVKQLITKEGQSAYRYDYTNNCEDVLNHFSFLNIRIEKKDLELNFERFLKIYNENSVALNVYMSSLQVNGLNIQQRVSILLNSLEGLLKGSVDNEKFKTPLSKPKKRQIARKVKEALTAYCESDEITDLIQESHTSKTFVDSMKEKLSNSLGHIDELSFGEMLDYSKNISSRAFDFVKQNKEMRNFWEKCKDHRNYFAHPIGSKTKGFNGKQSLYAMYILVTYYRLIFLELSNIEFDVSSEELITEFNNSREWGIQKSIINGEEEFLD